MRLSLALALAFFPACPAPAETVRFRRAPEPNEGAFSMLLPADWRWQGGITRVNPLAANGPLNAIAAKLDMSVTSPDGALTLRWYPETNYMDMRSSPAAPMFPPGSNYNGAPVAPKMNAFTYLDQIIFRRAHPRASGLKLKGRFPLDKVAQSYAQVVQSMRIPIQFAFDCGLIWVEYSENGAQWEEVLFTGIQDWGQAGAGLWTNKDTFSARAPAGSLEKSGPIVSIILQSIEINPKWVEGEIRGQIQRNEIAIRSQQDIQRLDREITEHRRRTNAEIQNQMFHNLMGTDEYVNPLTKKVEVGSNAWNYRWVNDRGEAVYTDDANFDPVRAGLQGYVKSPVRKRFPDK